jgi:alpha-mannosidase
MAISALEARKRLTGRTIWLWHYLHADWQWEQSRHWHEDRYALAVNEALDLMQRDSEFCIYFDTASEFYSAVARRLGPRLQELQERVREGRVRIVSAHVANTRPTQVGGGETYIRNLQLGRTFFQARLPSTDLSLFYSVDIAIGHVQMPQLLTQAGFKYYRAWRPHGPMNALGIPHQFIWRGIDGSRILVTRGNYSGGWRADAPPNNYQADWDAAVVWLYENVFHDQLLHDRSPTDHLWMVQGSDDTRPLRNWSADEPIDLLGLVAKWRQEENVPIRWCTPLEYSQAVAEQADRLPVIDGVLDGADVGYNIGNSGAHGLWKWRQMNDRRLLRAEWWSAAACSVGQLSPREDFKELWSQHCVYQAHAQDFAFTQDWQHLVDLARDVQFRAAQIENSAIQAIVHAAGGGTRTTRYVLNPHPWPVEADVEVYSPCAVAGIESLQVVDEGGTPFEQQQLTEFRHPRFGGSVNDERRLVRLRLPALGYRRVEIVERADPTPARPTAPEEGIIETADLCLVYRDHALREVHDRTNSQTYASQAGSPWPNLAFHVLDGQDWIFGGPEMRRERYVPASSDWLQTGPLRWQHRSRGTLGPYQAQVDTLVADRGRELQVRVRLEGHWEAAPATGFVTLLGNVAAGGAMTVDVPFAVEPRDPDHDIYVHNVPQDVDLGIDVMFERLRPGVFWGRSWADWSGEGRGVTLISVDGNYYWFKERQEFGHILLRCIELRPETWEANCPPSMTGTGVHDFRYAFRFHDGDWRAADPQRRALELRHPPVVARADYPTQATLPPHAHSFLRLDGPALLSAYYVENSNAYVRLCENEGRGGEVVLTLDWSPTSGQTVDLLGQPVDVPVCVRDREADLSIKPWQIVTLKLGIPDKRG